MKKRQRGNINFLIRDGILGTGGKKIRDGTYSVSKGKNIFIILILFLRGDWVGDGDAGLGTKLEI